MLKETMSYKKSKRTIKTCKDIECKDLKGSKVC